MECLESLGVAGLTHRANDNVPSLQRTDRERTAQFSADANEEEGLADSCGHRVLQGRLAKPGDGTTSG
jgi:hypothetical protein